MNPDPWGIKAAERALARATQARDEAIADFLFAGEYTHAQIAEVFGVTRQRVGQLAKRINVTPTKVTKADAWKDAQEAYRVARHAQQSRAESYSHGYAEETRAFFGDESLPQADVTEQRLSYRDFVAEYSESRRSA